MRIRIFGAIGVIWGGAMVVRWMMAEPSSAPAAYQAGQTGAAMLGGAMLLVGLYYFFKKPDNG